MELDVDMDINIQNKACLCKIMSTCNKQHLTQPSFTCSKLTIETLEQGMKYVQS